jgi:hypothetical protein
MKEIQGIISLHYLAGSTFDTEFWRFAKNTAASFWEHELKHETYLHHIIQECENDVSITYERSNIDKFKLHPKMWGQTSWISQIDRLGLNEYLNV